MMGKFKGKKNKLTPAQQTYKGINMHSLSYEEQREYERKIKGR